MHRRLALLGFLLVVGAGCADWDGLSLCFGGMCDGGVADLSAQDLAEGCPGNTLTDPGFERSALDWKLENADLELVSGGGRGASIGARVCSTPSASAYFSIGVDLASAKSGDVYLFSGWVMGAPQRVRAQFRERNQAAAQGPSVMLGDTFVPVSTQYRVTTDGSVAVSFINDDQPGSGVCFTVDDACLRKLD